MKAIHLRLIALISGIVLFDYLFFKQAPGMNAILFTPVIFGLIRLAARSPFKKGPVSISATGLLCAGIAVILYGSDWSVLAYMGAFLVYLGFTLEPELRLILTSTPQASFNFLFAPAKLVNDIIDFLAIRKHMPRLLKLVKLLILPLAVLFIFTTIYRFADPLFNRYFLTLDSLYRQFLTWLALYLSIGHLVFLFFTGVLITGIIYKGNLYGIRTLEANFHDELLRKRRRRTVSGFGLPKKIMALKDENKMGRILFLLLNLLLLLVNISEVFWLNGEFGRASAPAMSHNLHEGTGLLIFSIGLSILVMLYLFRKNLNFYHGNKWLVYGALTWIVQNAILAANVSVRNWFYISHYGLTYKRIGVIFFLLLVLVGLGLLWIKIRQKKTLFYLIRTNAWSFYFIFILFGLINWDLIIAKYNLGICDRSGLDVPTLMSLSGRTLQLMDENRKILNQYNQSKEYTNEEWLDGRIKRFMARQDHLQWQSFNFSDRKVYMYFREAGIGTK